MNPSSVYYVERKCGTTVLGGVCNSLVKTTDALTSPDVVCPACGTNFRALLGDGGFVLRPVE